MAAGDVKCGCVVCRCPNTRSSKSVTPECYLCGKGIHKIKPVVGTGEWTALLAPERMAEAKDLATRWYIDDHEAGWKLRIPATMEVAIANMALGIASEYAASEITGLKRIERYLTKGQYRGDKPADLEGNVEVRVSTNVWTPCYVYEQDPDDRTVLLLTGSNPFTARGWLPRAKDGKLDRFWDEGLKQPCWAVPQSFLTKMPLVLP
jgi:hypothetical protein